MAQDEQSGAVIACRCCKDSGEVWLKDLPGGMDDVFACRCPAGVRAGDLPTIPPRNYARRIGVELHTVSPYAAYKRDWRRGLDDTPYDGWGDEPRKEELNGSR